MLTNCPQCHKPYVRNAAMGTVRICPNCVREEQEQMQTVYDYVRRRPGSKIDEISEATGVSKEKVLKLMNEGKLVVGDKEATHCSGCSKELSEADKAVGADRNGKCFCRGCSDRISGQLKSISIGPKSPPQTSSGSAPPKKKDDDRRYGLGGG